MSNCSPTRGEESLPLIRSNLFGIKNYFTSRTLICRKFKYKSILVVLLWQFSTSLLYNLFLRPTKYIPDGHINTILVITLCVALISGFSPVAGFVADVKFGRINVLRSGTIIILVSGSATLIISGIMISTNITLMPMGL